MNEFDNILNEMENVLHSIKKDEIEQLMGYLTSDQKIFIHGEGRSGFMAKAFAMRLMHLSLNVHVMGETVTPAIGKGDVLLSISGSGTTPTVVYTAKKSKESGAVILSITTNRESELGQLSDCLIEVPAATKHRREGEAKSIQPLSSLFDQCVHVLCDAICLKYSDENKLEHAKIFAKHSNIQ